MHTRLTVAALAVTALALAAACADPVRPADAAGTYVLRSVAGDALPAVTYASPEFTTRAVADTLRLLGDGTGTLTRTATYEPPPPAAPTTATWTRAIRYRVTGGRVAAELVCGPAELCLPAPHLVGRLEGDRLVVEEMLAQRVPQVYERLGGR